MRTTPYVWWWNYSFVYCWLWLPPVWLAFECWHSCGMSSCWFSTGPDNGLLMCCPLIWNNCHRHNLFLPLTAGGRPIMPCFWHTLWIGVPVGGGISKMVLLCHLLPCLAILQRSLGILATDLMGMQAVLLALLATDLPLLSCPFSIPQVLCFSGAQPLPDKRWLPVLALVATGDSLNTPFLLER